MKRSAEVIGAGDAAGSRAPRLAAVRGGSLLAALSLVLVIIGVVAALAMWRLMNMKELLQPPRIEVH